MLVEEDKVIEHPHHRHDRRYAPLLEDRHAGGAVAVKHPQHAPLLLGERSVRHHHTEQQHGNSGAPSALAH